MIPAFMPPRCAGEWRGVKRASSGVLILLYLKRRRSIMVASAEGILLIETTANRRFAMVEEYRGLPPHPGPLPRWGRGRSDVRPHQMEQRARQKNFSTKQRNLNCFRTEQGLEQIEYGEVRL
jgi:hypothetical protein